MVASHRSRAEYIPLPNGGAAPHQPLLRRARLWFTRNRPLSYWTLLAGALLALEALRLTFWLLPSPLDPLVDYQALNEAPVSQHYPPTTRDDRAVVTTMYTDTFAHGVATLGHSLRAANTSARLVLAYFPEKVSARALCVARAGGWTPEPIARIAPPHGGAGVHWSFVDQYSKLALWGFGRLGLKSVVYLDADTLVRRNFDELFDLPYALAAGPDVFTDARGFRIGFNAGVMLLRPSTETFADLLVKLETAVYAREYAEQAYLNLYFGAHALRLPFVYNANVAIKAKSPALWKSMESDMRVVHYTLAKPFPPYRGGMLEPDQLRKHIQTEKRRKSKYAQELTWWEDAWNAMRIDEHDALAKCDLL